MARRRLAAARLLAFAALAALLLAPAALARSPPKCPTRLAVEATPEGVRLSWWHGAEPGGPEAFRVHRAAGADVRYAYPPTDEGYVLLATLPDDRTWFIDAAVEPGAAHSYVVTYDDGIESGECEVLTATRPAPPHGTMAAAATPLAPAWVAPALVAGALAGAAVVALIARRSIARSASPASRAGPW